MPISEPAEQSTVQKIVSPYASTNPFFTYPMDPPTWIVKDVLAENQIGFLAGDWNLGKTPWFIQEGLCLVSNQPLIGQPTSKRPVIVFDAETPYGDYRLNVERIGKRLNVSPEDIRQFVPILRFGTFNDPLAKKFRNRIGQREAMLDFIDEELSQFSNALVILDPLLEILPVSDPNKDTPVIRLFESLRQRLYNFPHAAFQFSLHLRKDRQNERTPEGGFASGRMLLNHPRQAFQEVSGSNKLGAHSDSRFMLAPLDDEEHQLLLKGFVRGKDGATMPMERSQADPESYNGFVHCPEAIAALKAPLSEKLQQVLKTLPRHFRFGELVDAGLPRSSLSRYIKAGRKAGVVWEVDGVYTNTLGTS